MCTRLYRMRSISGTLESPDMAVVRRDNGLLAAAQRRPGSSRASSGPPGVAGGVSRWDPVAPAATPKKELQGVWAIAGAWDPISGTLTAPEGPALALGGSGGVGCRQRRQR